ncbi:hypothetical protein Q604_UNBC03093G0001, partial [human gut metagenome]
FKCRDNDHKNDNVKIVRGVKGKKKRPPDREAVAKCACFYAGCGVNIRGSAM